MFPCVTEIMFLGYLLHEIMLSDATRLHFTRLQEVTRVTLIHQVTGGENLRDLLMRYLEHSYHWDYTE